MEVWDPDIVEPHNIPTQLYRLDDVGRPKVQALKEMIRQFIGANIQVNQRRWAPPVDIDAVYISGVDSMEARQEIWAGMKVLPPKLYIDGRMGALVSRIFAVTPEQAERYEQTLPNEGTVNEPCTARATFFTGAGISAVIGSLLFRFLRNEPIPFETTVHWGTMEVM